MTTVEDRLQALEIVLDALCNELGVTVPATTVTGTTVAAAVIEDGEPSVARGGAGYKQDSTCGTWVARMYDGATWHDKWRFRRVRNEKSATMYFDTSDEANRVASAVDVILSELGL